MITEAQSGSFRSAAGAAMTTYRDIHGPITAAMAEQEPEAERIFNRPPRPISPETRALMQRIETRNTIAGNHGTKRR